MVQDRKEWGHGSSDFFPSMLFGFLGLDFGVVIVVGGGGLQSLSSFFSDFQSHIG